MSKKPETNSIYDILEDDEEDILVTLTLEDDSEIEYKILTIFELYEQDYIVLISLDENGEENADNEVCIFKYFEDKDGNPSLENIETEEEYEAAVDRFEELLDEAEWEELLEEDEE